MTTTTQKADRALRTRKSRDAYLHDVDRDTWYEIVVSLFEDDEDRAAFYVCSRPDNEDDGHNHGKDEEWIAPLLVFE